MISVTNSFTNSLIYFAEKDKNFVVLDADLSDDLNLKKFSNLYPKRFILDVRFMIRSSLLEITSNFKSGELQIQAAQVRQMIRALFSNTDHRQKALAKIH